jgi:hypothetical protein
MDATGREADGMALEVIGAGFGRTGTDSMREALTILGFGPCHHMLEVIGNDSQTAMWRARVRGEGPGWDQLLEGYRSAVDWPSAFWWRELAAHWPQARVILTWRPADRWYDSFAGTILKGIEASTDPDSLGLALIRDRVFGGRPGDRDHAIAAYEANVAAVRAAIPADRLLVHQPQDGWGTLCPFLGVPVPDRPYPSRNSADDFRQTMAERTGTRL